MKQRYLTFLKIWNKLTEDYEKDEQFIENSNRELRRSKVQNKVKLKKTSVTSNCNVLETTSLQEYVIQTKLKYPQKLMFPEI